MPTYLVHAMEGRARLRHPALAGTAGRERALAVLSGKSDVLEARCGSGSILLLLTPDAIWRRPCRSCVARQRPVGARGPAHPQTDPQAAP